jgi:hypothetical protein
MIRLSIPLMNGYLPEKYLKPWSKFIFAVNKLLDFTAKTTNELNNIEIEFQNFYLHYER